jgi:dipeptidyl aminopeptidase/acylaminoacyl peptidase
VGHSAGGHLALWAAKDSGIAGVVPLAGVSDLAAAARSDMREDVAALLGGEPEAEADRLAEADPMSRLPLGVPVLAVHGSEDPLVPLEQSRAYVAAALAAGDEAGFVAIPGANHAHLRDPESSAWPTVRDCVARLARSGA